VRSSFLVIIGCPSLDVTYGFSPSLPACLKFSPALRLAWPHDPVLIWSISCRAFENEKFEGRRYGTPFVHSHCTSSCLPSPLSRFFFNHDPCRASCGTAPISFSDFFSRTKLLLSGSDSLLPLYSVSRRRPLFLGLPAVSSWIVPYDSVKKRPLLLLLFPGAGLCPSFRRPCFFDHSWPFFVLFSAPPAYFLFPNHDLAPSCDAVKCSLLPVWTYSLPPSQEDFFFEVEVLKSWPVSFRGFSHGCERTFPWTSSGLSPLPPWYEA